MDVGEWLRSIGLSRYEEAFRKAEIGPDVLPDLTDIDLEKLGVPLGDRKRLLKAIASFGPAQTLAEPRGPSPTPSSTDTAERRQLTVMFCDLVGSTALSARLDPEDMREVIAAYHRCCAELITKAGGFVAKYMGDGVLAYFGYPQAHEHDAERAVQAGLALVEVTPKLITAAGSPLHVRVGIATGLVVVGDLIGAGEAQEHGIVGETPNLAARLQALAEPNTVVFAEGTRRLLGNLFELQDLGAKDVKGIAGPVRAWAALRASSVESRFEALHTTGLTALVGREEELQLLLRCWSRARSGGGQVMLISGDSGIGKSRLTAALLESIAGEPHTRLRYFCSPQHTDSAFYPIIGQMERAAGIARNDTLQAKLDKLDALLAQTATSLQDAALLAEMLSLRNDGRYPSLAPTPQRRRQGTLDALTRQGEALTSKNPVLMIFEDAHWTDPTSLEAFGRVVDWIEKHRVLLVATFRPEFEPPWIGRSYVTAITINRLAQREVGTMIDSVAGNKLIAARIRQDIIDRTDGIPLFVEEMTKAVLEAENEGEARRTAAAVPSPALAVPASLHASLMARLDRLGPAKGVAQIGAAIGRQFSHALLAAVVRKPEAELGWALDRLIAAGLLFRQGVPPHAIYLVKHALVQDAAYGTLLREPRRALHACIAETLESQFAEIAERQPEVLARHCAEAGLIEKAAGLWGKAGQRSLERSALVEAAEQLTRALLHIAALPPATPALRGQQIKFQVALINTLFHLKGYGAPETKAAIEQARLFIEQAEALGEPPEDPLLLFSVLYGAWIASVMAFNADVARGLATQLLALAEKQAATVPLMVGHRMMGHSLLHVGEFVEARAHYDQAIALYDPVEHRPLVTRFGQDTKVAILSYRSWVLWLLGYPDAALADIENALKDAREIGHAGTLMVALGVPSMACIFSGNYTLATGRVQELFALSEEKGALLWKGMGTAIQGYLLALTGKSLDAVHMMASGITAFSDTGETLYTPFWLLYLARVHAELGQFEDAHRCIGEAMTAVEKTGERWLEAEVNRTAGEIALLLPKPDAEKAEAYFERALAVARKQQAKSWELRAAISIALLKRNQGKRSEARDLLAPIYGWFTEGFDTLDLKEAKALLDELPCRTATSATRTRRDLSP
jgi:class 3 adenylate cyclase/predicted ATPase